MFTQFREITAAAGRFLGTVFGRDGLVLHGGTAVAKRRELVRRFQEDETGPVLRALAQGRRRGPEPHRRLARHPFRPLVEPGGGEPGHRPRFPHRPEKNVLVHKFVCRGTVEDKIDRADRIEAATLAGPVEGGADLLLTEMSDDELLEAGRPRYSTAASKQAADRMLL